MNRDLYRYRFPQDLPLEAVQASLVLAAWGTESLHGEEVARRDAGYFFDPDRRQLVVDASLPAGLDFDKLFRGYVSRSSDAGDLHAESLGVPHPQTDGRA